MTVNKIKKHIHKIYPPPGKGTGDGETTAAKADRNSFRYSTHSEAFCGERKVAFPVWLIFFEPLVLNRMYVRICIY
jgi:hypothetical protein